jgi:hypothetical protein
VVFTLAALVARPLKTLPEVHTTAEGRCSLQHEQRLADKLDTTSEENANRHGPIQFISRP